jgi:hypothetical protein
MIPLREAIVSPDGNGCPKVFLSAVAFAETLIFWLCFPALELSKKAINLQRQPSHARLPVNSRLRQVIHALYCRIAVIEVPKVLQRGLR